MSHLKITEGGPTLGPDGLGITYRITRPSFWERIRLFFIQLKRYFVKVMEYEIPVSW
jgi:hypothetical protein